MNGKIIALLLIFVCLSSRASLAGGPLPVVYPEDSDADDREEIVQQRYIDNQAYLREFEQQRRERVLYPHRPAPVSVISLDKRVSSFSPFFAPSFQRYQSSNFVGIGVYDGATSIRYYNGYQPHCCVPRSYFRPPPVAVPYRPPLRQQQQQLLVPGR